MEDSQETQRREEIFMEAVCLQCDERWHLDTVHT